MDEGYFVELLLKTQIIKGPEIQPILSEIEAILTDPNIVEHLINIIKITPDNEFVRESCIIYLHQSIVRILSKSEDLDSIHEVAIQLMTEIFAIYENEENIVMIPKLQSLLKLFFDFPYKDPSFSTLFLTMVQNLFTSNKFYHAVLISNPIIKNLQIPLTDKIHELFLSISLSILNNFLNGQNIDESQISQIMIFILKAFSVCKNLYNIRSPEQVTGIVGYPLYYIPFAFYPNCIQYALQTSQLCPRSFLKIWREISKMLIYCRLFLGQVEDQTVGPDDLVGINAGLTYDHYNAFEQLYFTSIKQIIADPKIDAESKYIPIRHLSEYLTLFNEEKLMYLLQFEIILTLLDVQQNMMQFTFSSNFTRVFNFLGSKSGNAPHFYAYMKQNIFSNPEYNNPQNPDWQIAITIFLSQSIEHMGAEFIQDADFTIPYIVSMLTSDFPPKQFAALECVFNMLKIDDYSKRCLFSGVLPPLIQIVKQLFLSTEQDIVLLAFKVYYQCIESNIEQDFDFIFENEEVIRQTSLKFYYAFVSYYFIRDKNIDQDRLTKFINDTLPILQQPIIDVDLSVGDFPITMFSAIVRCVAFNETLVPTILPILFEQFDFFVERTMSEIVDSETGKIDPDRFTMNSDIFLPVISDLFLLINSYGSSWQSIYIDQAFITKLLSYLPFLFNLIPLILTLDVDLLVDNLIRFIAYSLKYIPDESFLEFIEFLRTTLKQVEETKSQNMRYALQLLEHLYGRIIAAKDANLFSFINTLFDYSLEVMDSYFQSIRHPLFIENTPSNILKGLSEYCRKNADVENKEQNFSLREEMINIYRRLHERLIKEINMHPPEGESVFSDLISFNNLCFLSDCVEALFYVPDMEENLFWVELFIKESENTSISIYYQAFDIFNIAITYQSVPLEAQNQIATFTIAKIGEFVQTQEGLTVNELQNAIFLLNTFVQVNQNPVVMEFLNQNIAALFEFVQNMNQKPLFEDNFEMTCLSENMASLYLNFACFVPTLDPQILLASISLYPSSDETENNNFLGAFIKLMNDGTSPYAEQLFQPIFVSLLKFFSIPTSSQKNNKIDSETKMAAVSLLYAMSTKIQNPETFIQEFFQNEPAKLFRITSLLQFMSSK